MRDSGKEKVFGTCLAMSIAVKSRIVRRCARKVDDAMKSRGL